MARRKKTTKKSISALLIILAVSLFVVVGSSIAKHNSDGRVEDVVINSSQQSNSEVFYHPAQSNSETDNPDQPAGKGDNSQATAVPSEAAQGESTVSGENSQVESSANVEEDAAIVHMREQLHATVPTVPAGEAYVTINDNVPLFTNDELINGTTAWERYGRLDDLGRVTLAEANLGIELMPADGDKRESLTNITPTGWVQAQYDGIGSGDWLYNRSHLIGYQLTGEQDNLLNLLTGTRYFNVEGMLPFENFVAAYVEENEVHVRYRVSPLFVEDELVARGVFMEGYSIEDKGALAFHIFVPNKQPGITIDYQTGNSTPN